MIQQTLSDYSSLKHHTEHVRRKNVKNMKDGTRNMNITYIIEVPYTTHHNNNKI